MRKAATIQSRIHKSFTIYDVIYRGKVIGSYLSRWIAVKYANEKEILNSTGFRHES